MKKNQENYLDRIPIKNTAIQFQTNAENHIIIIENHKGIWNRFFQYILKKPEITKIELDMYGSYVWKRMNGEKSIYEIGKEASQNFGPEIEPLYERIAMFIRTLELRGWVSLRKS